jgi:hypothetical protein
LLLEFGVGQVAAEVARGLLVELVRVIGRGRARAAR